MLLVINNWLKYINFHISGSCSGNRRVTAVPADPCTIVHDFSTRAKRGSTNLVENTPTTGKLHLDQNEAKLLKMMTMMIKMGLAAMVSSLQW